MFKKKKKRGKTLWINNIAENVHMNIKLLAIAEGKHMYQLTKELLTEALEARRLSFERGDKPEEKQGD